MLVQNAMFEMGKMYLFRSPAIIVPLKHGKRALFRVNPPPRKVNFDA